MNVTKKKIKKESLKVILRDKDGVVKEHRELKFIDGKLISEDKVNNNKKEIGEVV